MRNSAALRITLMGLCALLAMTGSGCNRSSDDTKAVAAPANTRVQQQSNAGNKPPKGHD